MLLTVALALEYESQCLLAEHRLVSGLSELEARAFVDRLISLAEPIELYFRWRLQLHDPGDELVLLVIAAAEKISAMETERFFAERRARADDEAFLRILNRKGGEPPRPEDSID